MMQKSKIRIVYLVIPAIILISFFSCEKIDFSPSQNSENIPGEFLPKSSGYWNYVNTLFYINDSDAGSDFDYYVSNYDWCSGSGTYADPFVIENLTIDGFQNVPACIYVADCERYWKVNNCTFHNVSSGGLNAGIILINASNGFVSNTNSSNNVNGFTLFTNANNNTFENNWVNSNSESAIMNFYSNNNSFNDNWFNGSLVGLQMDASFDCNFTGNSFLNMGIAGIFVNNSANITFTGNIVNTTTYGLYFDVNENITMSYCETNDVSLAFFNDRTNGSEYFDNYFNTNFLTIIENGRYNYWHHNYYQNYPYDDANDDLIGDDPYVVGTFSTDYNPIWDDGDDIAPVVNLITPLNFTFHWFAPVIQLEIIDTYSYSGWYQIDDSDTKYYFTGNNFTIENSTWNNLDVPGNHTIFIFIKDIGNHTTMIELWIFVDFAPPEPDLDYIWFYFGFIFIGFAGILLYIKFNGLFENIDKKRRKKLRDFI